MNLIYDDVSKILLAFFKSLCWKPAPTKANLLLWRSQKIYCYSPSNLYDLADYTFSFSCNDRAIPSLVVLYWHSAPGGILRSSHINYLASYHLFIKIGARIKEAKQLETNIASKLITYPSITHFTYFIHSTHHPHLEYICPLFYPLHFLCKVGARTIASHGIHGRQRSII